MVALALFWLGLLGPVWGLSSNIKITWEHIGQNLLHLRNNGVADESLMMTRLNIPDMNKTRISDSTVPGIGRGLFATTDIEAGEFITCYPGDVVLRESGLLGVPEYLVNDQDLLRTLMFKYSVGSLQEGIAIMGLPERCDDLGYCGHIINDGAKAPTRKDELERYADESNRLRNCEHMPLEGIHMVTLATREIRAGEELFVSYGPAYWMDHKETWRENDDS